MPRSQTAYTTKVPSVPLVLLTQTCQDFPSELGIEELMFSATLVLLMIAPPLITFNRPGHVTEPNTWLFAGSAKEAEATCRYRDKKAGWTWAPGCFDDVLTRATGAGLFLPAEWVGDADATCA